MHQEPPQSSYAEQIRPEVRCPTCGAGAEPGQLICLECGSRISLGYRKPPSWRVPVAIIVAVILVVIAGLGIGLREITSDADSEVAADQATEKPTNANASNGGASGAGGSGKGKDGGEAVLGKEAEKSKPKSKPKPKPKPKPEKPAKRKAPPETPAATAPRVGGLATWPKDRSAFTVVLVSTGDKAAATKVAKRAVREGVEGAGVLRSDDFTSLGKGFSIAFGGVYSKRPQAEKAAARFSRGFPGAFVQLVNGAARGSRG